MLAAGCGLLRINGLFLVGGLLVMYALGPRVRGRRPVRALAALALGPAAIGAYFTWLHHRTGMWDAWTQAQWRGFGRATAWPWAGLGETLDGFVQATTWHLKLIRSLEILAVVAAYAVTTALARRRWWPEFTYAALSTCAMSFSTIWLSSPRLLLTIFPMYLLLGSWASRHERARLLALILSAGLGAAPDHRLGAAMVDFIGTAGRDAAGSLIVPVAGTSRWCKVSLGGNVRQWGLIVESS